MLTDRMAISGRRKLTCAKFSMSSRVTVGSSVAGLALTARRGTVQ